MIKLNNPLSSIVRDSMTGAGSSTPDKLECSKTGRDMDAVESYVRILRETDSKYKTYHNYTFIDSYIDSRNSRNSRKIVTDQFLRLLKQTDGDSSHIRDIFAQLHTIH